MKVKGAVLSTILALILCIQIMFPLASAHTGDDFRIIILESGTVPRNPTMLVNDSALWINSDYRDNITHQIFVDANSDGVYNGSEDWKSTNLTSIGSCEYDEVNETKVDENCEATFTVTFNETVMNMTYYGIVGTYAYVDIDSNGTKFYGNITVNPEFHFTAGFQDNVVNDEEDNEDEERPAFLLFIAAGSGIGAAILGGMIIFGSKEED